MTAEQLEVAKVIGIYIAPPITVLAVYLKFRFDERIRRRNNREEAFAKLSSAMQRTVEWSERAYKQKTIVYQLMGRISAGMYYQHDVPNDQQHNLKFRLLDEFNAEMKRLTDIDDKYVEAKCDFVEALVPFDIFYEEDKIYKSHSLHLFEKQYEPQNFYLEVQNSDDYENAKAAENSFTKPKNQLVEKFRAFETYIMKNKNSWLSGRRHKRWWFDRVDFAEPGR